VKRYLRQLVEMEFVAATAGRFGATFRYRLEPEPLQPGHDLTPAWPAPGHGSDMAQGVDAQAQDPQPDRNNRR
jgi:hypothetical protein